MFGDELHRDIKPSNVRLEVNKEEEAGERRFRVGGFYRKRV